ncbi:MAG TPA: hypothetical protein VHE13_17165 [Opitutus sp.]|nr:hypothetical protein [Opitutus sp.]
MSLRTLAFLLGFAVAAGCARQHEAPAVVVVEDARLLGRWEEDRAARIARLRELLGPVLFAKNEWKFKEEKLPVIAFTASGHLDRKGAFDGPFRVKQRGDHFTIIDCKYEGQWYASRIEYEVDGSMSWEGIKYRKKTEEPDQAPEPTPPSVTPRADARVAPIRAVSHL